jgi:hypothetical protein
MSLDLSSLIDAKTLTGVIVGAILVWVGEFAKAKYSKSKNAHYLAVRLVPILEQFLDLCYDVAFDNGTSEDHPAGKDGVYETRTVIPTFLLPDDVDWKSINQKLLEQIMNLISDLHSINKFLAVEAEFNAHPPYDEFIFVQQVKFANLSLSVDEVLTEVRRIISRLPEKYSEGWDPRAKCRELIIKANANQNK